MDSEGIKIRWWALQDGVDQLLRAMDCVTVVLLVVNHSLWNIKQYTLEHPKLQKMGELSREMGCAYEWGIESFGEPKVCLSQGEHAVKEVFLARHPARRKNLVCRGDFILTFLVIKSLPWPRDTEVLQQSLVIAIEMWLLRPPMERQIVPFAPS